MISFQGKRGSTNRESDTESQIQSSVVTGETNIPVSTSVSEASKRLAPLLLVDQPSSEDEPEEMTQTPITSKFIRNGSELRRSLRRINSITRRKLSPSSTSVAAKSPKSPRKHSQGSLNDFVSHVWKGNIIFFIESESWDKHDFDGMSTLRHHLNGLEKIL